MASTEVPTEAKNTTPKTIIIRIILVVALLVVAYFGGKKIYYELHHESTDNAQVEAELIPILPRVSGYIKILNVADYTTVKKDSLLVEIDDADLQLQLAEMEADLAQAETDNANARASLVNAGATINESQSNVTVAQIRVDKAKQDYARDQKLFQGGAITQKQLDDSKSALDVVEKQAVASESGVNVSQTRVGIINAQLKKAEATIALKKATIEEQKLKISYTKIYAPCDGKIGKRNIEIGQYIQAGAPLFTIVNDKDFWVVANYKETQLDHIKPGDPVIIKLDAFPDTIIHGKIVSLSDATGAKFSLLPPDNATGNFVKVTQRVPVKIKIEDVEKYSAILRAGMNVDASVAY